MKYKSVLFDLDGMLVDNSEGIRNGFRYALGKMLGSAWDGRVPDDIIGPPLRDSFSGHYGMDAERTEEAVRLYREYYRPKGLYEFSVYPHVEEMLAKLRDSGAWVYLATSKPKEFSEIILSRGNLARYFRAVVGAGLDGSLGTKTEVIRHLLDHAVPPGGLPAVMVGDRWHDAEGARACGLDFAAALWGFGSREEFLPYACVKGMFADARELSEWLTGEAGK